MTPSQYKKELRLLIRAYFIRHGIKETSIRWFYDEGGSGSFMKGRGIDNGNPITIALTPDHLYDINLMVHLFSQDWIDRGRYLERNMFKEMKIKSKELV